MTFMQDILVRVQTLREMYRHTECSCEIINQVFLYDATLIAYASKNNADNNSLYEDKSKINKSRYFRYSGCSRKWKNGDDE